MPVILGIDAAWTVGQPSGVALVAWEEGARPRCLAVAPSYASFTALARAGAPAEMDGPARGSIPDIPALLEAAHRQAGAPVTLVAVDMPMATTPFSTRRAADTEVSREFGSRNCSTHSPSAERPGPLGARLSSDFGTAGFPLRAVQIDDVLAPALIEVYPHPALLSLLDRPTRVPYKVSKSRKYWPALTGRERIAALVQEYSAILEALGARMDGIGHTLPSPDSVKALSHLKSHEDMLDALVCAWVGLEHLAGRTRPLGDETAAIWVPADVVRGVTPPG